MNHQQNNQLATESGFAVEKTQRGATVYILGEYRVWEVRMISTRLRRRHKSCEGQVTVWQTARLIDGHYSDHYAYGNLPLALQAVTEKVKR